MQVVNVIPEFPPSVRSDTYAINYGRMLGAEWMARSAGWTDAPTVRQAESDAKATEAYGAWVGVVTEFLVAVRQAEAANMGMTSCPRCGHLRTEHGRAGCIHWDHQTGDCKCPVTYEDLR